MKRKLTDWNLSFTYAFRSVIQEFVEAPSAVITWVSHFIFCTPGLRHFVPFILTDPLEPQQITWKLPSLRHPTVRHSSWSPSSIVLAVCFESLSYWKVNCHPTLRSHTLQRRFSWRMAVLCFIYALKSDQFCFGWVAELLFRRKQACYVFHLTLISLEELTLLEWLAGSW